MLVHLTGSSRDSGEDLRYLREIISTLHKNGIEIAHNWVETSNNTVKNQPTKAWDWQAIVSETMDAIHRSDLLIVEVSSYAFFQGYQIAVALSLGRPVLAVSRTSLVDRAITGVSDELLTQKEYTDEAELSRIVMAFIEKYSINVEDKDVLISLDVQLGNYVRARATETGEDRDKILLELAKSGLSK